MRNDDDGFFVWQILDRLMDKLLCFTVHGSRRFVEDKDGRAPHQRPGERYSLPLPVP